jgi:hypothetical protein
MKNLIFAGLVVLVLSATAFGQGNVVNDIFDVFGSCDYLDYNSNLFIVTAQHNQQTMGLDYNHSVLAPFSSAGFVALGAGTQNSFYTPSNPGINGNFGMHHSDGQAAAAVISSGGWYAEYAVGTSFGFVGFTVNQPTQWMIFGNVTGVTDAVATGVSQAQYYLRLFDLFNNTYIVNVADQANNGVGDFNTNFNYGGTIPPGQYLYDFLIFAQHGGSSSSPTLPGDANTNISTTLKLVAVPEPASLASGLLALVVAAGLSLRRRSLSVTPGHN